MMAQPNSPIDAGQDPLGLPLDEAEVYALIARSSKDVLWIKDLAFRTVYMSPAIEAELGYTPAEYMALALEETLPPESIAVIKDVQASIAEELRSPGPKSGVLRRFEMLHLHRSGRLVWAEVTVSVLLDAEGRPRGYYGVTRNIEDRKRAERELEEAYDQYRNLVELLPIGVFESDLTGRVIYVNDAMYRIFGYPRTIRLSGIEISRVVVAEDCERVKAAMFRQLAGDRNLEHHYTAIRYDGSRFPIEIYSAVIEREGEPRGFRGVIIDASDKKRGEDELLKTNKLEAVSLLAGGIAHDFNNILAAVMGNINLASLEVADLEVPARLLREAELAVLRARGLTQRLLTFSRGGSQARVLVRPEDLVREVAEFNTTGSLAALELRLGEDIPQVMADPTQLSQLVQNLVINAVQALDGPGSVRVCLSRQRGGLMTGLPAGDWLRMDVEDGGKGVPEAIRDRIFDPYFTTKGSGSGIGLAVCLAVARSHGGDIQLDASSLGGARFSVFLPAASEDHGGGNVPNDSPKPTHGTRILFVDDEEAIRRVAAEMGARSGYRLWPVADVEGAMEAWKESLAAGAPMDLAIVDLTIRGGAGGKELLAALRELSPTMPIIVSSGYAEDPALEGWRALGYSGVLKKPYTVAGFVRAIEEALTFPKP
jgi:PAS domain S-box-containing protein